MNEFTLAELISELRRNLKKLILVFFVSVVVGLVVAFSIPKQFTASVSLAPEMSGDNGVGGMSGLASLAGLDFGGGTDAIGPDLYPKVVATNTFLVNLLPVQVTTMKGDTCTFQQYMLEHTKIPWWGYGRLFVSKLMKELFSSKKTKAIGAEGEKINPKFLTPEEEDFISGLRGRIDCSMKEDIIQISVVTQDPLVSMTMVDSVKMFLQNFVTQYRTNKARTDLSYYLSLEDSIKCEYEKAKKVYAQFCDSHRAISLQSYLSEKETLENELGLVFNAYTQVKQQVQLAQAKVQENTPAFTVVEDSSVPNFPTSPRKALILFVTVFVGCFGFLGWIYFRLLFFRKEN